MWQSISSAAKTLGDTVAPMIKEVLDSDNEETTEDAPLFDQDIIDVGVINGNPDTDLSHDKHNQFNDVDFDSKERDAALADYYKDQALQARKEALALDAQLQDSESEFQRILMQKNAEIKSLKKKDLVSKLQEEIASKSKLLQEQGMALAKLKEQNKFQEERLNQQMKETKDKQQGVAQIKGADSDVVESLKKKISDLEDRLEFASKKRLSRENSLRQELARARDETNAQAASKMNSEPQKGDIALVQKELDLANKTIQQCRNEQDTLSKLHEDDRQKMQAASEKAAELLRQMQSEKEKLTSELKRAQQMSSEFQQNSLSKIQELEESKRILHEQLSIKENELNDLKKTQDASLDGFRARIQDLQASKTELEKQLTEKGILQNKFNENEICLVEARAQVDQLCQEMLEMQTKAQEHEESCNSESEAASSLSSLRDLLHQACKNFATESEMAAIPPGDAEQQLQNILQMSSSWKLEIQQASDCMHKILTTFFSHPKHRHLKISEMSKMVDRGIREVFQQRIFGLEQDVINLETAKKELSQTLEGAKSEVHTCRRRINDLDEKNRQFRKKWAEVTKKDTTIAQLQAVIDQMREQIQRQAQELVVLRKTKAELQQLVESQAKDLSMLQTENSQHRNTLVAVESQSQDVQIYKQRMMELEDNMKQQATKWETQEKLLKDQLTTLHQSQASLKQELYDTSMQLKASQADLAVAQQDSTRSETALQNLHKVLEQFQAEKQAEAEHLEKRLEDRLQAQEKAFKAKESAVQQLHKTALEETLKTNESTQSKLEKEIRTLQAEVVRRDKDIDNIRHALDEAVTRLNVPENSTTVDKQLVVNLLVKYISSKRSVEVLDLIARMLDFSESERQQVGLTGNHSAQGSGLVGGLLSSLMGPASTASAHVEGDNLAEMWANFLISEAEGRR